MFYAPKTVNDGNFDTQPVTCWGVGLDGSSPLSQMSTPGTVRFVAIGGPASGQAWPGEVNLLSGVVADEGSGAPPFRLSVQFGPNFGGAQAFLGCSTTALAADAVSNEVGWLVAAGLGSPFTLTNTQLAGDGVACTDLSGPSSGLAPALTLATISSAFAIAATQVVQMASAVTRVRMVNGAGGRTWIVWSLDGEPTLTAGIVSSALTLDTMFPVAAAPGAQGALVPSSFAIESLGDALAVAVVDQVANGNDQVQVGATDQSGATLWSATVQTDGTVLGALSLRAAPDGSALLLAWSELPPGGTTHRIRVARLDCTTCAAGGAACATGSDCCGGGCEHGTCAWPAIGTSTACTTDAECGGGEACDLTLGGACIGSAVCTSDAECEEDGVCDTAFSMCIGGGDDCTSDAACPVGESCDQPAGRCLPGACASAGGACTSDHDCCSQACDTGAGACK